MDDETYLNREGKRIGAPSPSLAVAVKLGSIAVHAEEMLSPARHRFDVSALATILSDPELRAWLAEMDKLALLPIKPSKRSKRLRGTVISDRIAQHERRNYTKDATLDARTSRA